MTDSHQFIVTTMDMHTIDLEPYQYSGANITGIRLFDPANPMMEGITKFLETLAGAEDNAAEEDAGEESETADDQNESESCKMNILPL